MRPHQCCCLPAAEKTYCSAALISSPRAAFFLLHHAHQHAHRPLGARLVRRMQVSQDPVIIIRRIISGLWPLCKNRTLLSCCLDPYSSAVVIPDHIGRGSLPRELPCELWSETSRAFQAVRLYRLEPAFFFYSYHLDRFGHSVLASLVSLQDISSVTIGLTSFKRFGFRHLFRKVSGGCRPSL